MTKIDKISDRLYSRLPELIIRLHLKEIFVFVLFFLFLFLGSGSKRVQSPVHQEKIRPSIRQSVGRSVCQASLRASQASLRDSQLSLRASQLISMGIADYLMPVSNWFLLLICAFLGSGPKVALIDSSSYRRQEIKGCCSDCILCCDEEENGKDLPDSCRCFVHSLKGRSPYSVRNYGEGDYQ